MFDKLHTKSKTHPPCFAKLVPNQKWNLSHIVKLILNKTKTYLQPFPTSAPLTEVKPDMKITSTRIETNLLKVNLSSRFHESQPLPKWNLFPSQFCETVLFWKWNLFLTSHGLSLRILSYKINYIFSFFSTISSFSSYRWTSKVIFGINCLLSLKCLKKFDSDKWSSWTWNLGFPKAVEKLENGNFFCQGILILCIVLQKTWGIWQWYLIMFFIVWRTWKEFLDLFSVGKPFFFVQDCFSVGRMEPSFYGHCPASRISPVWCFEVPNGV